MDTAQVSRVVEVDWLAASPIGPHATAFKHHLTERRYAAHTIASYVAEVTHFARWVCTRRTWALNSARHALAEHHQMDELVEDLQALDPAGEAWGTKARELVHKVRHHLKEEETKFFQVSGKLLTPAQKVRLAQQYRKDYGRMLKVAATR